MLIGSTLMKHHMCTVHWSLRAIQKLMLFAVDGFYSL